MKPSLVYFLKPVAADGPIKIGCSQTPEARMTFYAALAPFPLEIAATFPGGYTEERQFHAAFAGERTHHEWFRPSPALTQTIARIKAGAFTIADLPAPTGVYKRRPRPPWSLETRLANRLHRALDRLHYKQKHHVPREVFAASERYALWGSAYGPVERRAEDALTAYRFLMAHAKDDRLREITRLMHEARLLLSEAA